MKYIFLLIFIINLKSEITLSKFSFDKDEQHFPYKSAMQNILFLSTHNKSFNETEKKLLEAIELLKSGNESKSKELFQQVIKSTNEDHKGIAKKYLKSIHIKNNNYSSISSIKIDYEEIKDLKNTKVQFNINDTISCEVYKGFVFIFLQVENKNLKFLLDTGSDVSIITKDVIENLIFKTASIDLELDGQSNGSIIKRIAEVKEVSVGNNKISDHDFFIMEDELELKYSIFNSIKFDGIIGWDLIQHFDLLFNLTDEKIILNPSFGFKKMNNLFWAGSCFLKVKQKDGYIFNFFVDIGAQKSKITDILPQKMHLEQIDEKKRKISGIDGVSTFKTQIYKNVTLYSGNFKFSINDVETSSSNNFGNCYFDGIVGADFFMKKKILFSPKNNTLLLLD